MRAAEAIPSFVTDPLNMSDASALRLMFEEAASDNAAPYYHVDYCLQISSVPRI